MQLTDLEKVSRLAMEGEDQPKTPAEMLKMMERQKRVQHEENWTNVRMRERILQLADEAFKYGYLE